MLSSMLQHLHLDSMPSLTGAAPRFCEREVPKLRTDTILAIVGTGVLEYVPLQKCKKYVIFKGNLHDSVHSFCLRCPYKNRCPISAKNRGVRPPLNPPLHSAIKGSSRALCHECETFLKLNFFQLMDRHHS